MTAATGGRRVCLQLDDLHKLGCDSPVEAILTAAMREAPAGFHLVATSRAPPAPVWVRHLAEGRAARIEAEDLALDLEEAAALIQAEACGGWTAEALVEASQGWMLGARMLLRGARGRAAGAADDEAGIVDLIDVELLGALSPADARLLRDAAPLDGLAPEIVAEAIGPPATARDLRALARRMLFLGLDADGRLRAHDLLKAAARQRWGDAPDADDAKRARAARALLARGDARGGLSLLSAASAWAELETAVAEAGPSLAERGDFGILLAALEPMPDPIRRASLAASYWYGVSLLNLDPPRARVLLQEAFVAAFDGGRGADEGLLVPLWTACVDGVWLEWHDCSLMDPLLAYLPALAPVAERHGQSALLARGAVAALQLRDPAHPDFPAWEARSLAAFFEPAPRHEAVRRGIQLLFRYCWGEGARWKGEQVRARLDHLFDDATAPLADLCTRLVATTEFLSLFEPCGEVVFETLERGLAATAQHRQGFWDITMINAALYRAASLEDRARLDAGIALLAERLGPQSNPNHVAIQEHFLAYRHWLDGRPAAALEHARTAHRLAVANGFSISPVCYALAIAAILPDLGRPGEAWRWMREARRTARAQRSHILTFMACLRGAALALAAGRAARALPYLRRALRAGAAQRLMAHPCLRRAEMAALLDLAAQAAIERAYVEELAGALDLSPPMPPPPLRLLTLGPFEVLAGLESRFGPGKAPRVSILAALHLVAAGGRGLATEELIDRLWPEADPEVGRKRLKSALYRLRRMFGDPAAVRAGGDRVALDPARVAVDAWELEALARAEHRPQRFAAALALHRGPFAGPQAAGHPELLLYGQHLVRLLAGIAGIACRDADARRDAGDWEGVLDTAYEALRRFGHDERLLACAQAAATALGRSAEVARLEASADA